MTVGATARAWSPATSSTPPRVCSRLRRPARCSSARPPTAPPPSAIASSRSASTTLKGKAEPGAGLASPPGRRRARRRRPADQLEAPFVGRDGELRLLKDLFHATGRERRARLVSIMGPGGIGKSRLAWEFEKYIDGVVETVLWHQGRSPAYGEGITFWALAEMVRGRAGIAEADDAATTRSRIDGHARQFVPDEAERRWIEPGSAPAGRRAAAPAASAKSCSPPGAPSSSAWRRGHGGARLRGPPMGRSRACSTSSSTC